MVNKIREIKLHDAMQLVCSDEHDNMLHLALVIISAFLPQAL